MIKFCPNCGKEVNSRFCPFCGYDMGALIANEPAAETPVTDTTSAEPPAEEPPVISFEQAEPKTEEPAPDFTFSTPQAEPEPAAEPEFTFDPGPEIKTDPSGSFSYSTANEQQANQTYNTYYIPPEQQKESVTQKTWFVILFLFLFWPLGLFFMWRAKKFTKVARIIITAVIGVLFVLNIVGTVALFDAADDYNDYDYDYDYSYDSDYDSDDYWDDSDNDYSYSSGQLIDGRTAKEAAESYLRVLNFSREGLIDQLEYEGYSNSEATAAVDSMVIDWNQQAAGSARSYLNTFPDWTRSEMIDQLEYEGFTYSQAAYGADAVGL